MNSLDSYLSDFSELDHCTKAKCCLKILGAATAAYIGYVSVRNYLQRRRLFGLIAAKRRQREENVRQLRRQLEAGFNEQARERNESIVQLEFEELRERLQQGQLTAVEVLEAFQWRALEAHEKTNCVCEFLPEARIWAKELDEKYGGKSKGKPPLFGIPFSNKECNYVAGHDSTIGCANFIGQPLEKDNEIVAMLKQAGAIPFVLTNLPQTMMSIGCSNPIFGVTTNPYDKKRSSGGSSGGEGAILAFRGAAFGLGGDIGGSVRVPAHFCGIAALKPSIGRLIAAHGMRVGMTGFSVLNGTYGPMGPNVDSLVWFMRVLCAKESGMFHLDPFAVPIPFNESLFTDRGPLIIGYYDHDNWLAAAPACRRAVDVAKGVLARSGHRLVPVQFPFDKRTMRRFMQCYTAFLFTDGGKQLASSFQSAGIIDPAHEHLRNFSTWPVWYKKIRAFLTRSTYWSTIYSSPISDTATFRERVAEFDEYKTKFIEFWQQYKLDCLICPVLATPALPSHIPPQMFCVLWSYCAVYNLLNFAAGVVKCTEVTAADEKAALKPALSSKSGLDEDDWVPKLLRECQKGSRNLPVGVQVVAAPFREELCLRVMKEIEHGLKDE